MSRSSASFSASFKVFSSLSEASAAFPNVQKLVPIVHYYPYGQTAETAAIPLKNSNKFRKAALRAGVGQLMFSVPPAENGMLWYSPFFDSPPACQSISESCFSSVACCGCMELSPDCDNCASCPIDYLDPEFPYFTNCTGEQISQIGPTYICVDKNVICTGDLFTVTFNIINISGGQWDWIPPNAAPPPPPGRKPSPKMSSPMACPSSCASAVQTTTSPISSIPCLIRPDLTNSIPSSSTRLKIGKGFWMCMPGSM